MQSSDMIISMAFVALAVVLVAAILVNSRRNAVAREKALQAYCAEKGMSYEKRKTADGKEVIIKGTDWVLTSKIKASRKKSPSDWASLTLWESATPDSGRATFMLGSIPVSQDWDNIAPWMQTAILEKLGAEDIEGIQNYSVRTLLKNSYTSFMLFEQMEQPAMYNMDKIIEQIKMWPTKLPLFINATPSGLRIKIVDQSIRDVELLERLTALGEVIIES